MSHAADGVDPLSPNAPTETIRNIDWPSATQDAKSPGIELADSERINDKQTNSDRKQTTKTTNSLVVPLLLPPISINFSDAAISPVSLEKPKIVTDNNGYASVSEGENVDILIDGSNLTFTTASQSAQSVPVTFDGDVVFISNGAQISIGRYGALYNVQLLCKSADSDNICVTRNMIKEVVESLEVSVSLPE